MSSAAAYTEGDVLCFADELRSISYDRRHRPDVPYSDWPDLAADLLNYEGVLPPAERRSAAAIAEEMDMSGRSAEDTAEAILKAITA